MGKKPKVEIEINGKRYPCQRTIGAIMTLEQVTGKSADNIDMTSVTNACILLWACVKSACKREGVEFGYTLDEFADNITEDDLTAWAAANAVAPTDGAASKNT